ncbi:MAG: hypothetical protein ACJ8F1_26265 [Polyangia bacterium]
MKRAGELAVCAAVAFLAVATVAAGAARAEVDAAAPEAPDPDAPTVTARVDRAVANVGDPVHLEVVAIAKTAVPVNLPSTVELGPFSLLDRKESEQPLGDGRMRRLYTLTIAAYAPGEKVVPPVEVTYLGPRGDVRTTRTAPVPVKIASLIANEPEPALKDAAPPVTVIVQNLWPAYIAGALVAAGFGALIAMVILRRVRARRGARPAPPPRPAHEVAMEKLDRLGAYGFLENADNRPFYFAVSEVIREYLGARYGFDSLELTTDELMTELRRRAGRELVLSEAEGWLAGCDLVKFAKISPSAAEARGALESAIRIVVTTRPVAAPLGGAALAQEAAHG